MRFIVRTDEHSSHSECAHSFNIQLNSFSIEVMVFGFRDPSFKLKSEGVWTSSSDRSHDFALGSYFELETGGVRAPFAGLHHDPRLEVIVQTGGP